MTATAQPGATAEQVPADPALAAVQLLSAKQVGAALGLHPRTLWRMLARSEAGGGSFPRPVRLGARTIRWRLSDISRYLDQLRTGNSA